MSRCHGNHRQNTLCSFSSSFTRFCSVRPSHNCFSYVKEKVGSVKPLFPLVGPNRHVFRLGPRTKRLIDPATLADAKLESTLTNESNKKLHYLIADLKSHIKLSWPSLWTDKAKPPCACRFASMSNDHSISDGETELETFQADTHIANRKDQATEY